MHAKHRCSTDLGNMLSWTSCLVGCQRRANDSAPPKIFLELPHKAKNCFDYLHSLGHLESPTVTREHPVATDHKSHRLPPQN